jgi:Fur family transcriptional regulator, peroxide stress response regulator
MAVSSETIETRMRAFMEACASRGVKLTHQRLEIYRELASTEAHPDADTIWCRVRERVPTISRDTVYRNLKLLAEHGLISIVGMSHERLRFDANMGAHHHFVCVRCGLIRDFTAERLEKTGFPTEAEAFGYPVSLHFEVKGICTACH